MNPLSAITRGQTGKALSDKVVKFTLDSGEKGEKRDEALEQLDLMDINRVTLFPGPGRLRPLLRTENTLSV